ncbi:Deoxyribonuclease-1 [Holothuria leucospilota]|uniref:Deoxyribonuclease n=1 Tax=Holothuria leucospilota TaxID=206669 RepID=A0A9Q1BWN2_HOLLE|nr:Deoxyribonuclease-1 [Holothuria leucospilota]
MKVLQIVFLVVVLCCAVQFSKAIQRRIGAFNIQVFGQSKADEWWVMNDLVQILKRYDLVLIQEIRDSSGTAIVDLLGQLNGETGDAYSMIIGNRQGRTSSKEEYCYFYKSSIFQVLDDNEYPVGYDHFERPPFNVLFRDKGDGKEFVASGLHAKPDHAVAEIDRMTDVYSYIQSTLGTSNVVMMGDFNADCSYVGSGDWSSISLWTDSRFNWLIDNYADTTVKSTNCAYDRIVTAGSLNVYSGKVYKFDTELDLDTFNPEDVSDHYPVEAYVN